MSTKKHTMFQFLKTIEKSQMFYTSQIDFCSINECTIMALLRSCLVLMTVSWSEIIRMFRNRL